MEEVWYTGVADELARCLTDARICAEACEALLARGQAANDAALQQRIVDAVVGPAAVSRVLIDLIDHPRQLVLAAATLCRDAADDAVAALAGLEEATPTVAALGACARSCGAFVESA